MLSISNTRRLSNVTITGTNKVKDTFEETPPLPTYLIAFIVSKYERNSDKEEFGVYARPEAKNATKVALDFGSKMLDQFGVYLNISYYSLGTSTKMDMAAIPDFSAGGKEFAIFFKRNAINFSYYLYSYGGETAFWNVESGQLVIKRIIFCFIFH